MTTLLFYFGKQMLCAGLFYGYYVLALRDHTAHRLNRMYLLLSVCLSIVLPLLPSVPQGWQWSQQTAISLPAATMAIVQLPVVAVTQPRQDAAFEISFFQCYAAIALFLFCRIVYNCWRIYRLLRKSKIAVQYDAYLVKDAGIHMPFSFFHYIFWNAQMPTDSDTGKQILQHELVHVRQRHTLDKLFMELVSAVCWINPFFFLYKRELALVHEFLADDGAAFDKATYAETILYAAFQPSFSITNNFFHPPIHRRIKMLFLKPTKISPMKKLALLPLAAIVITVISCHQQANKQATANDTTVISAADLDKIPRDSIAEFHVSNDITSIKLKDGTNYRINGKTNLIKGIIGTVTKGDANDAEAGPEKNNDSIFTVVDNPPVFPGGEKTLVKYLSINTRYPTAAMKQKITGTVLVQFTVGSDGEVRDAKVVGPHHAYLDDEAVRVVKDMPAWKPGTQKGKPVAVQFNLPVRFALEG